MNENDKAVFSHFHQTLKIVHMILLIPANGDGTAAAEKLVTDLTRLSNILSKHGIAPSSPVQHFELLLHLNRMAGSPSKVEVVACHILPGINRAGMACLQELSKVQEINSRNGSGACIVSTPT